MEINLSLLVTKQLDYLYEGMMNIGKPGMDRVIDQAIINLKDLFSEDKKFAAELDEYKQKSEKEVKDIENKALEALRTSLDIKTLDDAIFHINKANTKRGATYDEFMNKVKSFITVYIQGVKEQ